MVDWGMTIAPSGVQVVFKVSAVTVLLNCLHLTQDAENYSGLGDFIYQLARALTPQERDDLAILTLNLDEDFAFDHQDDSFPEFIAALRALSPQDFLLKTCAWMQKKAEFTSYEDILGSKERYLAFMNSIFAHKAEKNLFVRPEAWQRNYAYIAEPARLQALVTDTLSHLWEKYLRQEWERTQAMLDECANAFSQLDFSNTDIPTIVETVTSRDLRGKEFFQERMDSARHLIFVPSPHMGPYISWFQCERVNHDMVVFGARLPQNANRKSPALNRSELLVRLNALADETRLRILEMLTQEEEICAQDFITTLDLSQSSASRHLRQLTASGYITERRRDVAKCYTLNRQRIKDTLDALARFID
jgi:ArsR family transcriptional regulator